MRRAAKVKALAPPVPLRETSVSATAAARRSFPAWISAEDSGVAFTARAAVMPRVRDGLVLRRVAKKVAKQPATKTKGASDAHRAR